MADLTVSDITKEFPTPAEPLVVLRGASLELSAGENLVILGPSGSGKSTLLFIIGTLDKPTSGSVTLGGQNPFELSSSELADFRNHEIGFVFQDHYLLPQCSVLENTLVPAIAEGRASSEDVDRAKDLLERVGLRERLTHRPSELSGGERQRVSLARALVRRPALLLADEPTGNLDRSTAKSVGELLLKLQEDEQMMLLVVTHSTELAAMLDRRMEIDDGRLIDAEVRTPE